MKTCFLPSKFLIIGLVLMALTFIGQNIFQYKMQSELSERVPLVNGTISFAKWSQPKVPIYLRMNFFDIQNPAEFLQGKVPVIQEVGPITFEEKVEREIIGWNSDETLLTFKTRKFYHLREDLSNVSMDRNITSINLPLAGLVSAAMEKTKSSFIGPVIHNIIISAVQYYNESLIVKRTVRELMFEGYEVPIMQYFIGVLKRFKFDIPQARGDGKFGLMLGRNGSDEGEWTVQTGIHDYSLTSKIHSWNNKTAFGCWNKEGSCNQMEGTEGSIFPPPISKSSVLKIFTPDLNRSVSAIFKQEIVSHDLQKYRFFIPKASFDAPLTSDSNKCYCVKKTAAEKESFCSIDGILDIGTTCNAGLPVAVSLPHFLMGSPLLRAGIQGLNPSSEKHESFFDVEPVTGAALAAAKRLQLNVDLKYMNKLPGYVNVKPLIFPVNWAEESFRVDPELLDSFKAVQKVLIVRDVVAISSYSISALLIMISLMSYVLMLKERRDHKKSLTSREEESYPPMMTHDDDQESLESSSEHSNLSSTPIPSL